MAKKTSKKRKHVRSPEAIAKAAATRERNKEINAERAAERRAKREAEKAAKEAAFSSIPLDMIPTRAAARFVVRRTAKARAAGITPSTIDERQLAVDLIKLLHRIFNV